MVEGRAVIGRDVKGEKLTSQHSKGEEGPGPPAGSPWFKSWYKGNFQ